MDTKRKEKLMVLYGLLTNGPTPGTIEDYSLAQAKGRLESGSGVLRIWKRLKGSQERKGMNVVNEDRKEANMKLDSIMTIVGVLSLVGRMHATMVVHDPVLMAKQSADEVVNFAKWAKTEVDAAQTQLNTLQTYENTVLQVVRMGNPRRCETCRSLVPLRHWPALVSSYWPIISASGHDQSSISAGAARFGSERLPASKLDPARAWSLSVRRGKLAS